MGKQRFTIDHFFLATLSKKNLKQRKLFMLCGAAATVLLLYLHYALSDGIWNIGGVLFTDYIDVSLLFLCATVFGNVPALLIAIATFVVTSVTAAEFAYTPSILMMTILLSYLPVCCGWYRSKLKTTLAAVLEAAIAGFVWCLMLRIIKEKPISLLACVFSFGNAFVPMLVNSVVCYAFFNYAPEHVKALSSNAVFYTDCYRSFKETVSCNAQSKLSNRVMFLIIGEAVILGCAAVVFTNLLVPKIRPELLPHVHGRHIAEFMRNKATLSFDLKMFLLMMNVTVPLCIFINYFGQHTLAYPIRLMAKAMEDYTRDTTKEELNSVLNIHLLPIKNKDEIGDLYRSLKITAHTLSKYIDNIEREKQLEADLEVAKAASKAKSAFLSNMSHEIRTPINAVLGMNEMILRESTDKDILQYAADIKSASTSLLSIVNDILDFSKIEAGKMEIIPVQYDLSSAVNDLVNMIQKRAEEKHLALHVDVAPDMPHMLFGDDVRIKQVLLNILTNAVKYTNEGSVTMRIGWKKDGTEHILLTASVADTGIGIKQEDLSKLFSAFERIEEQRNRTIEGTGLGMNIVQQLLAMMESELHVESTYGKGSVFSFELRQKVLDWEPIGDFTEMYKKSIATNSAYRESFHAPDAHILIVDDTKLNLTVIRGLLKQTQVQIDTAESGQETLALVKKRRYDVIFIDHRMPIMDGIETLHAMHCMEGNLNEDVPCVALTANAIQGAREMYLAEGFTDYLAKPVQGEKLEKLLIRYLPPEKVVLAGSAGFAAAGGDGGTSPADATEGASDEFPPLEGIDIASALANCGGADVLKEAMQEFYATIEEKAALIAQYAAARDWKNYTVLVHALKSSARLIGAGALSDAAKRLEDSGNAGNEAEISAKTPALLSAYRSYTEKLAPLCAPAGNESAKPLIEDKELSEALIGIREFVTAFDFDSADQVMQLLESYRVPQAEETRVAAIKKALAAVDRDALLKLF